MDSFRSNAPAAEVGPRLAALLDTRRWLMMLLFSVAWSFAFIAGFGQFNQLWPLDRGFLIGSTLVMLAAWFNARNSLGPVLAAAGPLTLVLAAAANNGATDSPSWIALSVSASHVTYAIVVMTGWRTGLLGILAAATALAAIWSRQPTNVATGPLAVAGGSIAVATLVAASFALWVAWHALLRQARAADAAYMALSQRTAEELQTQERSRAWRHAAVSVHETLLSTIRYVLESTSLDRAGLSRISAALSPESPRSEDLADAVRTSTAARVAAGIVRLDPSAIDPPVSSAVRKALRAAIVESALNAVQHGAATAVAVTGELRDREFVLRITDDGSGIAAETAPGIGWTSVLDDGLTGVGGSWRFSSSPGQTTIEITVPLAPERNTTMSSSDDGFRQGRLLMAGTLIAIAVIGIAYYVLLLRTANQWGWPMLLTGVLGTGAALAVVIRSRPISPAIAAPIVLTLAAIPWLVTLALPSRDDFPAIGSAFNAAGYGLLAVAMWSRWYIWLLGLGTWAAGVLATAAAYQGMSHVPLALALLNCLVSIPVVASVANFGTKRFARAQTQLEYEREAIRREVLRASAALIVDQHLSSCVNQAEALIEQLAAGAELTAAVRRELNCLDGLIRATIQVDPSFSGGFARAASELVNSAFSKSIPAEVGILIASGDRRYLPSSLMQGLERAIGTARRMSIRSFTADSQDYLAIELELDPALGDAALTELPGLADRGIAIEIEREDTDRVQLLLSRTTEIGN